MTVNGNGNGAGPEAGPPPVPEAAEAHRRGAAPGTGVLKEMSIQDLHRGGDRGRNRDAAGSKKHYLIFRMVDQQARRSGVLFAEG